MTISIIILAAGKGTRMRSETPKVLHTLAGRSLLEHVYTTACQLSADSISIVYGQQKERLQAALSEPTIRWVEQAEQLGSGHAVALALEHIPPEHQVLILYGDVPLVTTETLQTLIQNCRSGELCLLSTELVDADGYGRILRDEQGGIYGIVEHADADPMQRSITEINTGILVGDAAGLANWLQQIHPDNAQQEIYLTDCIALAATDGVRVQALKVRESANVLGINTCAELVQAERYYQQQQSQELLEKGLFLADPQRFDLRGTLRFDCDTFIDVNVILQGEVVLGKRVKVGANCQLRDVQIADDVCILPNCVIEGANIGNGCRIGPFARIRPQTILDEKVHIGNFVEVKNSHLATAGKANHLSYVGDSTVGAGSNIGAGAITCNYDGAVKHRTRIDAEVFVGSNAQLIAPVHIGAGATIAAGSTITRDVEANALAISRTEQQSIPNWQKPKKNTEGSSS